MQMKNKMFAVAMIELLAVVLVSSGVSALTVYLLSLV